MPKAMTRGKQQILYNYLPNSTFDYESVAAIARVVNVRGEPQTDLNSSVLIRRIFEEVRYWQEDFRPALRDSIFQRNDRFILLDPTSVQSELFPKVLWCQNKNCNAVFDYSSHDHMPNVCPTCHQGRLIQLRFVKIHRCGAIQPLSPPQCRHCGTASHMYLDTRKSERISNFKWVCRNCNISVGLYAGNCPECQWPDPTLREMSIEVHRAGKTYYAHTTVLLNVPNHRFDGLFRIPEWPAIAAAKFLGMTEVNQFSLSNYQANNQNSQTDPGLSGNDLDDLLRRQLIGEITAEELVQEMQRLREKRQNERNTVSPTGILQNLVNGTGVSYQVWENCGQETLEAVMPYETGNPVETNLKNDSDLCSQIAKQMGLSRITLVSDYPIITATYGYSRTEYQPNLSRLNPFPARSDYSGKYPIFVDQIQADAILISLDPDRVLVWLEANGCTPQIPHGNDQHLSRIAYFFELLNDAPLRSTISVNQREARMVFGLLHTLSHLTVRQAALLCGLDRTSLSEYLLPRTLTFALYCNHRFGATIGALTALFEQSLTECLNMVRVTQRCVYDPVCRDTSGNCHACTHLAETSCRFFNLNLSRAFLFGGIDEILGDLRIGYFDPSL